MEKMWFCNLGKRGSYYFSLRFNPLSTLLSLCVIIVFIATFCADETQDDAASDMSTAVEWITEKFTWFYIGSQNIWLVFLIYLAVSKYGNLKLGKQDEEPEFSFMSWFVMLFAAGIGVGFFFYGVSEPLWHYDSSETNRYMHKNEIQRAQDGINVTIFHWGIHGWIVYAIVAMNMSIVCYRWGLPMSIRSCFYPLLGDRIFGVCGDLIDSLSAITTLFGVCTSLGLGAKSLNAGLHRLDCSVDSPDKDNQTAIIVCITAVATISVVSGLGNGIKYLSWITFVLGNCLCLSVLFLDDTWFLLDLMVQSVGYYFQYLMEIGWWCDAFVRQGGGLGVLDKDMLQQNFAFGLKHNETSLTPNPEMYMETETAPYANWMRWWTIFYWGWWISWSPFVGMFIAKISRGRTIRQFVVGTMAAPLAYTILWFSVFGGAGIRMERMANQQGLICSCKGVDAGCTVIENVTDGTTIPSTWIAGTVYADLNLTEYEKPLASAPACCGGVHEADGDRDIEASPNPGTCEGKYHPKTGLLRLGCDIGEANIYDLVGQPNYGLGDGSFLIVITLICLALYFVTSSDSGSLVIDCLLSNGEAEPPAPQRIFWAWVECACAVALLQAPGDNGALKALQNASICTGLPYTVVICFMCTATWRAVLHETRELWGKAFSVDYLNPLFNPSTWPRFIATMLFPFYYYHICAMQLRRQQEVKTSAEKSCPVIVTTIGCFLLTLVFWCSQIVTWEDNDDPDQAGVWALGWIFYLLIVVMFAGLRNQLRIDNGITGNALEDIFGALCVPLCAMQVHDNLFVADAVSRELYKYSEVSTFQKHRSSVNPDAEVAGL